MAYKIGQGATIFDIIEAMDEVLQQEGWVVHEQSAQTYDGQARLSYAIWEGSGDGNDKIYLQAHIPEDENQDMYLDSMAGYDHKLYWFEQPGSIQQWLKCDGRSYVNIPKFTVSGDERFSYWVYADTYHVVGVARMSIVYESFYAGFINPIASERQYPYPMYVAGNGTATGGKWPANTQGSFIFPSGNSGFLRRADGVWRAFNATAPNPNPYSIGTVFPYNAANEKLIPNFKQEDAVNQDNFLLIPVMLQTNDPIDVNGILRNVFWVSGTRDIAAEQILVYNGEQYMVYDTKQMRGSNSYFCVKMV